MTKKVPYNQLLLAANNVLNALDGVGHPWNCLVGGMAVQLLGVQHPVTDIDILVLFPKVDQHTLKETLVSRQPNDFYLADPQKLGATFKLLKYRIPGTSRTIKIDLLLSNEPNVEIPRSLRPSHFVYRSGLPIAPIYFVLYHKLIGWEDRVNSFTGWRQRKANNVDYPDIINLCDIAAEFGVKPLSKSHMGAVYLQEFPIRANRFMEHYRWHSTPTNAFRQLGFPVRDDDQVDSSDHSKGYDSSDFEGYEDWRH